MSAVTGEKEPSLEGHENKEKEDGEEVAPSPKFSLRILEVVKAAQNQNGLRGAANYQRYRQYCTRRLHRLRRCKDVRFMYAPKSGRGFNGKKITPEIVDQDRYLFVPLFAAERAWSYSLELKANSDAAEEPRKYFHMKRRLAKAAKLSSELLDLCAKCGDERTHLEAQAYSSWMNGNYALTSEDWEEALQKFSVAQRIYTELSKVGSLSQKDLFSERVEEIDPPMRFCKFNIGLGQGMTKKEHASLLEMRLGTTGALQRQIDSVLAEARKQQATSMDSISWLGTQVPLRGAALRQAIIKSHDSVFNYKQATEDNSEKQDELFTELLNAFDDAMTTLRADMTRIKDKGEHNKETLARELSLVRAYIKFAKLKHVLKRNEELAQQIESSINDLPVILEEKAENPKSSKPEDAVKIYDALMQYADEAKNVEGVEDDTATSRDLAARSASFRAKRCFFLARAKETSQQWSESFSLYKFAVRLAEDAIRLHKIRESIDSESEKHISESIVIMNVSRFRVFTFSA